MIDDDAIDALLREAFEGPVANDGFCEEVIEHLPAVQRANRWPIASGVLGGFVAVWVSLGSAPILRDGVTDWLSGVPSSSAITLMVSMAGMGMLAVAWAVAEIDNRAGHGPRMALR